MSFARGSGSRGASFQARDKGEFNKLQPIVIHAVIGFDQGVILIAGGTSLSFFSIKNSEVKFVNEGREKIMNYVVFFGISIWPRRGRGRVRSSGRTLYQLICVAEMDMFLTKMRVFRYSNFWPCMKEGSSDEK